MKLLTMERIFVEKFKSVVHSQSNRSSIFQHLQNHVKKYTDSVPKQQELLYNLLYEIHVEWVVFPKLEDLFQTIHKNKYFFSHPFFDNIKQCIQEEEAFISTPPEIDEGVIECKRCHGKKTFSFTKQTRSSDEAVTVFVRCVDCGHQFCMG
jgi:DNA-directed RNA polymerase subunit M/transcription elongation factor TFIIS